MVLRNDQMMAHLSSEFQRTNDGSFAWESLISAYMGLPVLKGFWPMSSISSGASPTVHDLTGNILHLTNGGTQLGHLSTVTPGVSVANFGVASTDRLYRADEANLHTSFTASGLISASRGLTAGAWVRFTDLGTANECIMGIWDSAGNDREWMLYANTNSQIGGYFSNDGTNVEVELISSAQHGVANDEWHFICLQVSPTAQEDFIRTWLDDYSEENAHGKSALNDSAVNFGIGHNNPSGAPDNYFEGQISMAFLCGGNIGDAAVRRLYYRTRPAFQSRALW